MKVNKLVGFFISSMMVISSFLPTVAVSALEEELDTNNFTVEVTGKGSAQMSFDEESYTAYDGENVNTYVEENKSVKFKLEAEDSSELDKVTINGKDYTESERVKIEDIYNFEYLQGTDKTSVKVTFKDIEGKEENVTYKTEETAVKTDITKGKQLDDRSNWVLDSSKSVTVKYLYVDGSKVEKGSTITDVMLNNRSAVYTQTSENADVYKANDGTYKVVTDTPYINGIATGNPISADFAKANDLGEGISEGVSYDLSTKVATIEESAMSLDKDGFADIQVQVMIPANIKDDLNIPFSITDEANLIEKGTLTDTVSARPFMSVNFKLSEEATASKLTQRDIQIYLNGATSPISMNSFIYDNETGEVALQYSGAQLKSIDVLVKKSLITPRKAGIAEGNQKVGSYGVIAYLADGTNPDAFQIGASQEVRGKFGNNNWPAAPADGPTELFNSAWNSVSGPNADGQQVYRGDSQFGIPTNLFGVDFTFRRQNGSAYPLWEGGYNSPVPSFCHHVQGLTLNSSANLQEFKYPWCTARVLDKQERDGYTHVVIGFETNLWQYDRQTNGIVFEVAFKANGSVNLVKTSEDTDVTNGNDKYSLEGAEYTVYRDTGCTQAVGVLRTDASGNSNKLEGLTPGNYFVKETKHPKGYVLDETVHTVSVTAGSTATIRVSDNAILYRNTAPSVKTGEGVVSIDINVQKDDVDSGKGVEGIEFEFFRDGKSIGTDVTDETGKATLNSRITQTFKSAEYIEKYIENWDELNQVNKDEEKANGYWESQELAVKEADRKAQADLDAQIKAYENTKHTYAVKEVDSGKYYDLGTTNENEIEYAGPTGDVNSEFTDQRYVLNLSIKKYDSDYSEDSNKVQGTGTLKGAVYGLYAAQDIMNPETQSEVLYAKDELVHSVTTDETGKADTSDFLDKTGNQGLYFGSEDNEEAWYYWKEITPSPGYVLDTEKHYVTRDLLEDGDYSFTAHNNLPEKVRTGNFKIIKTYTNGEDSEIMDPEVGAEFAAVCDKYYNEVDKDFDKALQLAKEQGTEHEWSVFSTDEQGEAVSGDLAYGTYIVKQTKLGENAQDTEILEKEFTFTVSEDRSNPLDVKTVTKGTNENGMTINPNRDGVVVYNINNRPNDYYVRLTKKDLESGKVVVATGTKFQMQKLGDNDEPVANFKSKYVKTDENGIVSLKVGTKWYNIFTTNSDNKLEAIDGEYIESNAEKGVVVTPELLQTGTYKVIETQEPNGYLINKDGVNIELRKAYITGTDEDGEYIVDADMYNEKPKGKIIVNKTDVATEEPIEGVKYVLTAKEDIIDPADNSVIYEAGTKLSEKDTDANGQVVFDNLYMGVYEVQEVLAKEGYVLNKTVHEVTFERKDNTTKEYVETIDVVNVAPTGKIEVAKTDDDSKTPLEGAQFELRASEDIYSLDGRNTLLYHKGDLVAGTSEQADRQSLMPIDGEEQWVENPGYYVTDKDGKIVIEDLPLGKYTLKETYFPLGYYTEDKEYSIDLSYSEEEPLKVLYEQKVGISNKKTVTEITKSDVTTEEELEGAKLTVTDENGKTIDTWVSTNEKHVIKGLEVGKTYTLIEDYAPLGYLTANSIEFTVKDNFEVTKVVMHDDFTKWEFTKVDEQGDQLKGATLQVIKIADNSKDNDENSNANVDEDESSDESSQESVEEDKDGSKDESSDENSQESVEEDKDGSEEDLSYIQEPAKIGTVVDEWVTDGTPHRTDKLEIGSTYVLREKSAPKGYEVADDLEFTVEATPEIQKLKMTDKKIPEVPTSASSNLPFIIGGGVLLVVLLGIVLIVLKRR